jgi:hypothetical protein
MTEPKIVTVIIAEEEAEMRPAGELLRGCTVMGSKSAQGSELGPDRAVLGTSVPERDQLLKASSEIYRDTSKDSSSTVFLLICPVSTQESHSGCEAVLKPL